MNKTESALRMALEALHGFIPYLPLKDEAQCGRYDQAITAIKEALAQPEQEPVAWIYSQGAAKVVSMNYVAGVRASPLYTTPPQRKPLTDEQIAELCRSLPATQYTTAFARAIEAAHGIKE